MTAPAWSSAAIVVRPGATPKTKTLVGLAGRTSATLGSAANRLVIARPVWITWPDPASMVRLDAAPGVDRVVAAGVTGTWIWAKACVAVIDRLQSRSGTSGRISNDTPRDW